MFDHSFWPCAFLKTEKQSPTFSLSCVTGEHLQVHLQRVSWSSGELLRCHECSHGSFMWTLWSCKCCQTRSCCALVWWKTSLPGWGSLSLGAFFVKFSEIWILRYWCREIDLMLTFGVEWRNVEKFWLCRWTVRVAKKANDNPEHYRHNFTWSINKQLGVKLQLDGFLCLRIFQCFATALEFCQGGPGVVESRRLVGRLVGWWELVGRSLGELVTSGGMVWERTFWLIYKMFGENIESEFCLGFIWIKEKPVLLTVSYIWITLECSCLGELHLSHSTCFNFVVEIDHPIKFADLDVQTPRVLLFFCFAFPGSRFEAFQTIKPPCVPRSLWDH